MSKQKKELTLEKAFFITGWIALGIGIIIVVLYRFVLKDMIKIGIPCIFNAVTGLYCPGCGGTRAVISLMRGHFIESFLYHPVVIVGAVLYVWFMVSWILNRLSKGKIKGLKYRHAYLWMILAIFIINCILRNILLLRFGITL